MLSPLNWPYVLYLLLAAYPQLLRAAVPGSSSSNVDAECAEVLEQLATTPFVYLPVRSRLLLLGALVGAAPQTEAMRQRLENNMLVTKELVQEHKKKEGEELAKIRLVKKAEREEDLDKGSESGTNR